MSGINRVRDIAVWLFWIVLSLAAGWTGSQFTPGEWYASLVKPAWTPPNVVFPVVWTSLYLLMGTAAWLVWRSARISRTAAPLALFILQLLLNALWSWLFFGAHRPMAAFVEIIALLLVILWTLTGFWKISRTAGALLLPYLVWVGIASVLNFQLWRLNG